MISVDFAEIEILQHQGNWAEAGQIMIHASENLEKAGADFIVICTNTMHKFADDIQSRVNIPILHIADATAKLVKESGIKKIGLLGTRFTMEEDFYKGRLVNKFGLEVIIPGEINRSTIHRVIYDELVLGDIKPESKKQYINIIEKMAASGVEGIILGCTEIGLLVKQEDSPVPLFDTTRIHAQAAVDFAVR